MPTPQTRMILSALYVLKGVVEMINTCSVKCLSHAYGLTHAGYTHWVNDMFWSTQCSSSDAGSGGE
jgi:hypothetical protein